MERPNFFEKRVERMRNTIDLIPTKVEDLDLVMSWESKEPNVIPWSREKHEATLKDPNFLHLLISRKGGDAAPVGYSILKKDSDKLSVEFVRLVVSDEYKYKGYGVLAFENIWNLVFNKLKYSRIWHDVFVENEKAVKLYEKLGYKKFKTDTDPVTGRDLLFYEMSDREYASREQGSLS